MDNFGELQATYEELKDKYRESIQYECCGIKYNKKINKIILEGCCVKCFKPIEDKTVTEETKNFILKEIDNLTFACLECKTKQPIIEVKIEKSMNFEKENIMEKEYYFLICQNWKCKEWGLDTQNMVEDEYYIKAFIDSFL